MAFSQRTRGQMMALFMLVGIVILFIMGMFIFLKGATRGENIERLAIKATGASSFREHAESCLRYETLNAVDTYGLLDGQEPYIEAAVRRNLPQCIDWDFYEQEGFDITAGKLAVTATITEDALVVETDYAITGEDQTGQFALEGLDFSLPRENAAALSFDGTGRTAEETVITSTDGDAELIVPEGVRITDGDGNPVEEVAVRMLERDFNGLENPLAIGMVVYEVVPHVMFSNPVTLRVRYRDADVPSGIAEEDIRLAQFDERTGLWYSVPTEVDAEQNILDARFTSFSPATPVERCGDRPNNRIEFPVSQFEGGLVFLQDCGDAETCALGDGWKVTEEGLSELSLEADETGSLKIVTPERGEDGAFQAVKKPYNQVPLSGCAISDWDKDDIELLAGGIETDVTGCTVDDGEDCEGTVEGGVSGEELLQACRESIERYKAEHVDYTGRFELSAAGGSIGDAMRDHAPYADTEISGCSCTLKARRGSGTDEVTGGEIDRCTPVKATAPTYGYPAIEGVESVKELPGGFAILRFRIPSNGGGCIAKDGEGEDAKLRIEIRVTPSDGDRVEVKINPLASMDAGGELTLGQGLAAPVEELTGRPEAGYTPADGEAAALRAKWDTLEGDYETDGSGEYEVYAGGTFYNDVYIRVEDANGDGCAQATLDSFAIYGAGISFDVPRTYERCTVTVQDRINYLCGCDTPGCTGNWGVGSELNILANWRGAWNPTAGSIVNGQTLLCDLDQNDGRLQGLMKEGWSPFGGKCGEGPMLPVAEGEVCGDAGIIACDYEKNAVVECSAAPSEEAASSQPAGTAYVPLDGEQPDEGVQDDEQSPGNGEESTAGTGGPVWTTVRECGQDDICRIVGDTARCMVEVKSVITEGDTCTKDDYGHYRPEEGTGRCYVCVLNLGTEVPTYYWKAIHYVGSDADPACSAEGSLRDMCVSDTETSRSCVSGALCRNRGEGGRVSADTAANNECKHPPDGQERPGDVCCEWPAESEVEECVSDSLFQRECKPTLCSGEWTSVDTTADDCRSNMVCCQRAVVGGEAECSSYDVSTDAGKSACSDDLQCKLLLGACVPESAICPTKTQGSTQIPAGSKNELFWDAANWLCWKCNTQSGSETGAWSSDTSVEDCGCTAGTLEYRPGASTWFSGEGCKKCDGLGQWSPTEIGSTACPERRCESSIVGPGNIHVKLSPGASVCIGRVGTEYKYEKCTLEGDSPRLTTHTCNRACTRQDFGVEESCACPGGVCNTCFPAGFIQMYGREGEYKLTGSGTCYVCHGREGHNWDVASGCTCTDIEYDETGVQTVSNVAIWLYDWDKVNKVCRRCVADTSDPQTTPAHWITEGISASQCGASAMCLTHPTVSVPESGIGFNEWLCIAPAPNAAVQKCMGNGEWGETASCNWGCQVGQKIPPSGEQVGSTPLAWCDPANH